jgi:WD40 repeat protein
MTTINSVTSVPNQFDLLNIGTFPQEILHNIFSNIVNSKDIHSLWSTCHHFRWAISDWTPFWTTLLENNFPGSYTLSPNIKPFDVYNDCLELENMIGSGIGICKHTMLCSLNKVQCIIKHEENLIAATGENIEIWKDDQLQKLFPLQKGEQQLIDAMVAYKDKLFVASGHRQKYAVEDSMINVYDLNSGKLLLKLKGHDGEISDLCKIENKLYSVGFYDGTIKIWDMDTLEKHSEIRTVAKSLLPHKNTLYSGSAKGTISAWDLNTRTSAIFHQSSAFLSIDKMLIHGDKFILIEDSQVISVINFISKQRLFPDLEHVRANGLLRFGRLLFSARHDGRSVNVWDLNIGKKLMEHMFESKKSDWVSSSSMVFSEGKLVIPDRQVIHVFDFAEPIKYKKWLERLTKVDGQLEALQLAIGQKNRNEIIACVDNLIAVDPKNIEFCEFLCEVTQGIDIPLYEFLERKDFDHREILRKADFDNIKTAADKFTEKLKIDRNAVVSNTSFDQFHHIIESHEVSSDSDQSDESNDVAMGPSESESED